MPCQNLRLSISFWNLNVYQFISNISKDGLMKRIFAKVIMLLNCLPATYLPAFIFGLEPP